MIIGLFLCFISLSFIAYQDFISRSVHWWLYLLLYAGTAWFVDGMYPQVYVGDVLINVCICFFVVSLTTLFYILKHRHGGLVKLKNSIGMGDIVMIPVFIYCFSPINFIVFFIFSICVALIIHMLVMMFSNKMRTIPLAGYWSILLFVVFFLTWLGIFDIKNDNWIYLWLTN